MAGIRLSLKTETGRLTEDPRTAVEICQAVRGMVGAGLPKNGTTTFGTPAARPAAVVPAPP